MDNRGCMYKITCSGAVNKNRYQITAMAMYYDPKVCYRTNLSFNFMSFNENLKKFGEKK